MTRAGRDRPVTTLLFDLDGVLVDTEDLVREGWRRVAEDLDVSFTEDDFRHRMLGRRTFEVLTEVFGLDTDHAQRLVAANIDDKTTEVMDGALLREIPGAVRFVEAAITEGLAVAVVTSASPVNARLALEHLGLAGVVGTVVDASATTAGKPDPEPYLQAAERLGQPPTAAVVFEDSPAGCTAGVRAGSRVIGVTTTHTADDLHMADAVIDDFLGIPFWDLGVHAAVKQSLESG